MTSRISVAVESGGTGDEWRSSCSDQSCGVDDVPTHKWLNRMNCKHELSLLDRSPLIQLHHMHKFGPSTCKL